MEENDKKYNMEVLNNFIGYGNPNSDYWFMGLEEHIFDTNSEIAEEKKRLDIYKESFLKNKSKPFSLSNKDFVEFKDKDEKESSNSPSYKGICKIFKRITGIEIEAKHIGDNKIGLFICNLFPLARPKTNSDYNQFTKNNIFDGDFNLLG